MTERIWIAVAIFVAIDALLTVFAARALRLFTRNERRERGECE